MNAASASLVGIWGSCITIGLPAAVQGAAAGHPGYSANLSSNKAIRQQQLLCDPGYATEGSTSTLYYPAISSLLEVDSEPGYVITGVYVQVYQYDDGVYNKVTDTIYDDSEGTSTVNVADNIVGAETGLVQVFWSTPVDTVRPADDSDSDTDTLVFGYDPNVADTTVATYSNIGDPNGLNGPDSYSGIDPDGNPFTYSSDPNSPFYAGDFTPGIASGDLDTNPVPEPASLGILGLLGLGLRRRRT